MTGPFWRNEPDARRSRSSILAKRTQSSGDPGFWRNEANRLNTVVPARGAPRRWRRGDPVAGTHDHWPVFMGPGSRCARPGRRWWGRFWRNEPNSRIQAVRLPFATACFSPHRLGGRTQRIEARLLLIAQRIVEFRERRLHGLHRAERGVEPLLHRLDPSRGG